MNWSDQAELVQRLSELAEAHRRESARLAAAIGEWRYRTFGRHGLQTWAFAAGAWWMARRSPRGSRTRKLVTLATSNFMLFMWRMLNREVPVPIPGSDGKRHGRPLPIGADQRIAVARDHRPDA